MWVDLVLKVRKSLKVAEKLDSNWETFTLSERMRDFREKIKLTKYISCILYYNNQILLIYIFELFLTHTNSINTKIV